MDQPLMGCLSGRGGFNCAEFSIISSSPRSFDPSGVGGASAITVFRFEHNRMPFTSTRQSAPGSIAHHAVGHRRIGKQIPPPLC